MNEKRDIKNLGVSPEQVYHSIQCLCSKGDWDNAVLIYENYIEMLPKEKVTAVMYSEIAGCCIRGHDFDKALNYIKQGEKNFSGYWEFAYKRALISGLNGNILKAVKALDLLRKQHPDKDLIHYLYSVYLAKYKYKNGDLTKAISAQEKSVEFAPDEELKDCCKDMVMLFKLEKLLKDAINKAKSFKTLDEDLRAIFVPAFNLDEEVALQEGRLVAADIIQAILISLKGGVIDKAELMRQKSLYDEIGHIENGKLLETIIKFNDYVRDIFRKFPKKIPAEHEKKALTILSSLSDFNLSEYSLVEPDKVAEAVDARNYLASFMGSTSLITEDDVENFKETGLLLDKDASAVYWMGHFIPAFQSQEQPYRMLILLLEHSCNVSLSKMINGFYEEEKFRKDARNRQRKNISRIKSRLNNILKENQIGSLEWHSDRIYLRDFDENYELFENYVVVSRKK
ncbi:hypothetical protein JXA85_05940 [Candidatus Woesearchaeota archaeon]|nr:hypothetical protein [Candidatus Woesearchaeota archaeon]